LEILAFPCNQFGKQEPKPEAEIKAEVSAKWNVTFQLFSKIDVNGKNTHPLYRYLKKNLSGPLGSTIRWNFAKFLIDRSGKPVKRYSPPMKPLKLVKTIKLLLEEPVPPSTNKSAKEDSEASVEKSNL